MKSTDVVGFASDAIYTNNYIIEKLVSDGTRPGRNAERTVAIQTTRNECEYDLCLAKSEVVLVLPEEGIESF